MDGKYPIAETASLFADPARTAMLVALLDGQSLPASELALRARVSAQAASMHLGKLLAGRLVYNESIWTAPLLPAGRS